MTEKTVITVGAQEPVYDGRARYVDGRSAIVHDVRLGFDDQSLSLRIMIPGRLPEFWPYADLRAQRDQARATDGLVLSLANGEPGRLYLDARDTRLIHSRARRLSRRVHRVRRVRLFAGALVAAFVLALAVVGVPQLAGQVAGQLPPEAKAALGDQAMGQYRRALGGPDGPAPVCLGAPGQAALTALAGRVLGDAAQSSPPAVTVIDASLIDAIALPGPRIVITSGALNASLSPDDIAALIAHQFAHLEAGDPVRSVVLTAGPLALMSAIGLANSSVSTLALTAYPAGAEAEAREAAQSLLQSAGISPDALDDFARRLAGEGHGDAPLLRHVDPKSGECEEMPADAAIDAEDSVASGLMTEAEWRDLQSICVPAPEPASDA